MPKKTKIIFISVFIIVGIIIFLVLSWLSNKNSQPTTSNTPWYQDFNPFGSGSQISTNPTDPNIPSIPAVNPLGGLTSSSRFYKITDFAVAGATYLDEKRLRVGDSNIFKEPIKTIIPTETITGRKEIQDFLNQTLSLNPKLTIDGVFGKSAVLAIKSFQKLNNIPETGLVDKITAPYFTKTIQPEANVPQFENAPSIRYVERDNGHVYKMFLDTKIKEKISNSTIPGIYQAFFSNTGQSVVYRYLSEDKSISSFLATFGSARGEFLPPDITELIVSNDGTRFFYLTENKDGVTGTIRNFASSIKNIAFTSPYTEWLPQWGSSPTIYLNTKPSYEVAGSLFALNTNNGTLSKVLGGVAGLTSLVSPNGNLVLYSSSESTGPKLNIFDVNKHESTSLNTYGLPEKCVWSKDSINIYCGTPNIINGYQYPDYWYQGLVSFDDFIIKINTMTREKTTLANSLSETPVDTTQLFLGQTEDFLFFLNKKDSSLWSFYLN